MVDNDPDFIRLVEWYLVGSAWKVVGAAEVDQAYAMAQQRQPRAILLDVIIPGRDDWELLLALKESPTIGQIPVIICSVLEKPKVTTALGASLYFKRPIDQGRLLAALASFG